MTATPPDQSDPWTLATSNKYDVDNFYTRSTDSKGHSHNVQAPISPAIYGEIQALIQSGAVREYRTVQDVIRDAIIHRLKYVTDRVKSSTLGQALDIEIMLAQVDRAKHYREGFQQVISRYREELTQLDQAGDKSKIVDLLEDMRMWEDPMPEPYKTQLVELSDSYERRYGPKGKRASSG